MSDLAEEEQRRVAYHESGHAAMAHVLHRRVAVVSIRPGEHHAGVTLLDYPPIPDSGPADPFKLTVDLPARFRRALETAAMISLAGRLTELLVPPEPGAGYVARSDDELLAESLVRALVPREAARLAEADRPTDSDETTAHSLAWSLAGGGDAVGAYLAWLRATTASVVRLPRFAALVGRLVPLLLEHEVLGAGTVHAVFKKIDERRGR